jgi:hypothetical protein
VDDEQIFEDQSATAEEIYTSENPLSPEIIDDDSTHTETEEVVPEQMYRSKEIFQPNENVIVEKVVQMMELERPTPRQPAMDDITYYIGPGGNIYLMFDAFSFIKRKRSSVRTFWRCTWQVRHIVYYFQVSHMFNVFKFQSGEARCCAEIIMVKDKNGQDTLLNELVYHAHERPDLRDYIKVQR